LACQVNHRVFAVDLIAEVLKTDWLWHAATSPVPQPATPGAFGGAAGSTALRLLGMLVARGADRAPTVRARSLGALAALAGAARDLDLDAQDAAPLTAALLRPCFAADPPSSPDRKTPSAANGNAATAGE
jgi:hypothetical protein